jgi:predicted O-methyltransferase YrrM
VPDRTGWWEMRRAAFDIARRISNLVFGPDLMHRSPVALGLWRGLRRTVAMVSPVYRRQARFERENPEAPWLVPDSIPFIEGLLRPGMRGLEWGAGRSTLWLARQGLTLVSIEGRRAWHDEVQGLLKQSGFSDVAQMVLVDVPRDYDVDPATIDAYAAAPQRFVPPAFDFILVDGHFRTACLRRVPSLLAPGGILVVDNAETSDVRSFIEQLRPYRIGDFDNGICITQVYRAPPEGLPALS